MSLKGANYSYRIGLKLFKEGKLETALIHFNKTLKIFPNYPEVLSDKGAVLAKLERYEEAFETLTKALRLNPNLTNAMNNMNFVLKKLGKSPQPEEKKDLSPRHPFDIRNNPEHQGMLNAMFEKSGGFTVKETRKLPYEGKDSNYQFVEGLNLLEAMKLQEARSYYEKSVKRHSDKGDLWNNLGVVLKALHNNEQAFQCFEKALQINPQYYIGWYNKGGIYFDLEYYEKAIESFNKALELNSDCGEAKNDRTIARDRLGIFSMDGMQESFDMMMSGRHMRAVLNKGSALVDLGNGKDAIIGYSEKFYKNEEKAYKFARKGKESMRAGKHQEALRYYDKAIQINPEIGSVWLWKSHILTTMNRRQEGFQCAERALELDPHISLAWLIKGSIQLEDHQRTEAVSSFLECLRIDPFDEDAKNQLQKAKTL